MNINLKPCPFCGGEAEIIYEGCFCFVKCTICHARTMLLTDEQRALHFWNTRKPMGKIVERLEQIKMRYFLTIANTGDENSDSIYEEVGNAIDKAIEIIKEEMN